MNKKFIIAVVALTLTLALAGGVMAATPNLGQGQGMRMGRGFGGLVARVANFLGLELKEVVDSRLEGKTFADILGDRVDEFVQATVTERQTILDGLVRDGKITADQAALFADSSGERLRERLQSTAIGCGNGASRDGVRPFAQIMRGRMQRNQQQWLKPVPNQGT